MKSLLTVFTLCLMTVGLSACMTTGGDKGGMNFGTAPTACCSFENGCQAVPDNDDGKGTCERLGGTFNPDAKCQNQRCVSTPKGCCQYRYGCGKTYEADCSGTWFGSRTCDRPTGQCTAPGK